MTDPNVDSLYVSRPNQQHMLHLFFPVGIELFASLLESHEFLNLLSSEEKDLLKKIKLEKGSAEDVLLLVGLEIIKKITESFLNSLFPSMTAGPNSGTGPDMRVSNGVHFISFYFLPAGKKPSLKGPCYPQSDKHLLVIQAIYDDDFRPYIASFVQQPSVANGLNLVVDILDESGISGIDENGPNSANYIKKNGGVAKNPDAFNALLENYNLVKPDKVPAEENQVPNPVFLGIFPGLTVGKILQYYPDANKKWPFPAKLYHFEQ